jgi:hypothetical protein
VTGDGRSDRLEGLPLLAVHLTPGLTSFFLPGVAGHWGAGARRMQRRPTTGGGRAASPSARRPAVQ